MRRSWRAVCIDYAKHLIIAKGARLRSNCRSGVCKVRGGQATMEVMGDNDPGLKKQWISLEKALQMGISLPAATFVGWLIGAGLDRWLHTNWIYIAGLLVGIIAGFVQLIRVAMSLGSKD